MKRKTFKGILIKRLLIGIPFFALLLYIFSGVAFGYYFMAMESNFMYMESLCVNKIYSISGEFEEQGKDVTDPENLEYLCNNMKIYMGNDMFFSTAGALYYEDTQEKICDSEEIAIIAFMKAGETNTSVYFCDTSYFGEYVDLYKKLHEEYNYEGYLNYTTRMEDCYLKGNKFLPGTIEVEYISKKTGETIIEVFDLHPSSDITDDYEYYVVDGTESVMVGPNIYGSAKGNGASKILDWYTKSFYENDNTENYEYINSYSIFDSFFASTSLITLADGTKIRIFNVQESNLMDRYMGPIITFYVVVTLVAILIIVITARLKYVKLRAGYDMEDYRRTMTNAMAHDLKSPLMAISGYAENLKNNVHTDKKDYYAESIINNVDYMNNLIANILDLSKVEGKKIKFNKEQIDVRSIFEETAKKYDSWIEEKSLSINIDGELSIKGEKQLILQAFDNIIGNAVKYCDDNSTIEVILDKKKIIVKNMCKKMPSDNVSDLWKPFVKGDNSRSNKSGSGIGLTIVKNILESHGYKMKIAYEENVFKIVVLL